MTKAEVKNNIDNDIRLKTAVNSINPENVGKNMKDIVDLIPDPTSGVSFISLPTPQIAKRKIKLPKNGVTSSRDEINGISNIKFTINDLANNIVYPDEYYKERFDIYFNTYGDNLNWLSLPEKRIELCLLSTKYNKPLTQLPNHEGNKDYSTKKIVHPANGGLSSNNITNTIYSGGEALGPIENNTAGVQIQQGIRQTEWLIDETDETFGDNIYDNGLNGLNNPNITVELDVRDFFKVRKKGSLQYPHNLDTNEVDVRSIGQFRGARRTGKIYKRNSVLFFRLSAALPYSWNEDKNRYDKRVFSDLSQPIYISPRVANFYEEIGNYETRISYMYGHRTTIGVKR